MIEHLRIERRVRSDYGTVFAVGRETKVVAVGSDGSEVDISKVVKAISLEATGKKLWEAKIATTAVRVVDVWEPES